MVLGRHVYRVSPQSTGQWRVQKEGESTARGSRVTREEALAYACELAGADEPSKVIVEEPDGAISDERLFGTDTALELERAAEAQTAPPPRGEPPERR
jgi:hypothetical protein